MVQTPTDEQPFTEPRHDGPAGVRLGRWPRLHVAAALLVTAALVAMTALVAHGATPGRRSTFVAGFSRQGQGQPVPPTIEGHTP